MYKIKRYCDSIIKVRLQGIEIWIKNKGVQLLALNERKSREDRAEICPLTTRDQVMLRWLFGY